MANFTIGNFRLEKLLECISKGKIQLPDFQRPWIWDDYHITNLLSSVSRQYPIGTLMMLNTGGKKVNFATRTLDGVIIDNETPEMLILDGQQRLTALYQSLFSQNPANPKTSMSERSKKRQQRWYYMDIKLALSLDEESSEESIQGYPNKLGEDYEYEKMIFPLSKAFRFSEWRDKCYKYHKYTDEIIGQLQSFENKIIKDCFYSYEIPYVALFKGTPLVAICPIFERINSQGVNLDVFDLLIAIYAAKEFNLRRDWEIRRSKLIEKSKVLQEVRGTDFLKTVTLISTYNSSKSPGCKRKDILDLPLEEYLKWADIAVYGFDKALKLLANIKIFDPKNIPYATQLIPLSAILALIGEEANKGGIKEKIIQWYWCGALGERYGGAQESRFARDVIEVIKWIKDENSEPATVREASFSVSRLLSLKDRKSPAFKAIYALILQEGAKDFFSDTPIEDKVYYEKNIDIHHIFPKKWCEENDIDDDLCDCIVNKTPLSEKTNNYIKGTEPKIYLQNIQRDARIKPNKLDQILESHLIKPNLLRENNFDSVFKDRESKLIELIKSAMGKEFSD